MRQREPSPASQKRSGGKTLLILLLLAAVGASGWQLYTARDKFNTLFARTYANTNQLDMLSEQVRQHDERLGQLETRLTRLQEDVDALSTEVDELNEKVLNPANEPIVTKGDLDRLQKEMEGLQGQLQQWVNRWQDALKGLIPPATSEPQPEQKTQTPGQTAPSTPDQHASKDTAAEPSPDQAAPAAESALPPAVAQLQQQLGTVASRLEQLFQNLTRTTGPVSPASSSTTETAEPATPSPSATIDATMLKRWAHTLNLQWLLNQDPQQALRQLHALEQLIPLSDLPQDLQTRLIHAIGEDTAYLRHYPQADDALMETLDRLRQQIDTLRADQLRLSEEQTATAFDTARQADSASPSQAPGAPLDRLLNQLGQLVEIQKKSDPGALLSAIDRARLHQLMQTRLRLLLDDLRWQAETRHVKDFRTGWQSLAQWLSHYYPGTIDLPESPPALPPAPRPLKLIEAL